jgi:hypothetical protein
MNTPWGARSCCDAGLLLLRHVPAPASAPAFPDSSTWSVTRNSTAQRSAAQPAQHSAAQRSTAQHSAAQHSTAQHSTAQHSTAQQIVARRNALPQTCRQVLSSHSPSATAAETNVMPLTTSRRAGPLLVTVATWLLGSRSSKQPFVQGMAARMMVTMIQSIGCESSIIGTNAGSQTTLGAPVHLLCKGLPISSSTQG